MPGHDIIAIAASAGGVEALMKLVGGLPADLEASLFVVLHMPAQGPSLLPKILSRSGPLPAYHPEDMDPIKPRCIYVAPPDHHLMLSDGVVRVVRGPKENRSRPSADPLFRSAARSYGPRVVGVVLTGALDDGTAGLRAIKQRSGIAVVQDPEEALYPGMPRSAIENVAVDHIVSLNDLPSLLVRLTKEPVPEESAQPVPLQLDLETRIALLEDGSMDEVDKIGTPAVYACPECHGTLWEINDNQILRFRCRVGHAYTADSMLAEHSVSLEAALWAALRALEENASLARRMADRARDRNHSNTSIRLEDRAQEAEVHAAVLRSMLSIADTASGDNTENG